MMANKITTKSETLFLFFLEEVEIGVWTVPADWRPVRWNALERIFCCYHFGSNHNLSPMD